MGRSRRRAGHGCSPGIRPGTDPAPGGGGGGAPKARVGWGGRQKSMGTVGEGAGGVPARSKMVGVWETGEGEQVPPPRQPLPPWRYPHGPLHGEILGKNRARLLPGSPGARRPTGYTPDTAAHQVSPRTDPAPRWGRGRSAAGAGGVGVAGRSVRVSFAAGAGRVGVPAGVYGYPLPQARVGWGLPAGVYGYPLPQARGGWGCRQECTGILCRRRG